MQKVARRRSRSTWIVRPDWVRPTVYAIGTLAALTFALLLIGLATIV